MLSAELLTDSDWQIIWQNKGVSFVMRMREYRWFSLKLINFEFKRVKSYKMDDFLMVTIFLNGVKVIVVFLETTSIVSCFI